MNYVKHYIFLLSVQRSFIYEYFTSHTKNYFVVCYGSGNIVSIYWTLDSILLRCSHYNICLSNRMGLLSLVNRTPVRCSSNDTNNMIRVFLDYRILVNTLSRICLPFSCTFIGILKPAIYISNKIFWKYHMLDITICYSALCLSLSKNDTPTICHRRRG